jgi:RHS repeat-associated protein
VPNLSARATGYAHRDLLDVDAGLQHKGQRWYTPDLGRFVSEDPIQDGSNWYAFAGNNPVTYADPTGLYQQGHPLQGGSRNLDGFLRNSVNAAIARPSANPAPSIDRSQLDVYANQMAKAGALRTSLQSQLSATHNSLANRSFYEVFDKSADRARIASLTDQLVDATGRHSAARSNYTQLVNGSQGQRSNYEGYQYQSTAAAFGSGLGGKAVGIPSAALCR